MSEYQRYEFMTVDRPLTRKELDKVNDLSSHIEASSTHALIEYNYGDFKHDPIKVLRDFFDGFLYWANWGTPQLALRFPHGVLPADLIDGYDFDEFVTFKRDSDHDILDIHFGEMEAPDQWTEYELGSLIDIRDELMDGDLRSLYIAWLATQQIIGFYDDDEEGEDEKEDYEIDIPPVPPAFKKLTAAQKALAELLQVPKELLAAAAQHSKAAAPSTGDDVPALIKLLPPERGNDYLIRLAQNEPGLSRLLVKELRDLNPNKAASTSGEGERVPFDTLHKESSDVKVRLEREERERKQAIKLKHLKDIHDKQSQYWQQVEQAASRGTGVGYDEAVRLLLELREAANHFHEDQEFQKGFSIWVRSHLRRPALIKRLQGHEFSIPEN